jgi:hypothetical protein
MFPDAYPTLTVTDAVTGQPICDAHVLLTAARAATGVISGPAVQTLATTDAAAYVLPGYPLDSGNYFPPETPDGSTMCVYSTSIMDGYPLFFSVQVSHTGYRTEEVSNMHATGSTGTCPGTPATPQVVDVKLIPVGS